MLQLSKISRGLKTSQWLSSIAFASALMVGTIMPAKSLENQPAELLSNIEFPEINVTSFILINKETKRILLENNSNEKIEPASMTKVMTAYIVFDYLTSGRINENDEVLISEKAWRIGGSKMFIEVNKSVKVIDLLRGLIIQSGNDASIALAEHIAGTEESFASLMNQYATDLGMTNSHFKNSSGWPDSEHVTTANDLAILTLNMIDKFPEYYKLYSEREFTYNEITQSNRNRLLWKDARVDGVKTGHTEDAGYCLIGSSRDENSRYIAVVTGAQSVKERENAVHSLLKFAHANYQQKEILSNESLEMTLPVLEGVVDSVELQVNDAAFALLPQNINFDNIVIETKLPKYIVAPVDASTVLGTAVIKYNDEVLQEVDLYSRINVEQAGFFGRMVDKIKAIFL